MSEDVSIAVRLFGSLREEAGCRALDVTLPAGSTVADLRAVLAGKLPSVELLGERLAVSVNLEIAPHTQVLGAGDEVALLPPVAGGSGAPKLCTISERPLDETEVVERPVQAACDRGARINQHPVQVEHDALHPGEGGEVGHGPSNEPKSS